MDQPSSRQVRPPLVERLKSDDENTLNALYAANYKTLEFYVLRNNGSVDDAKDIYQEAFLAVWRNVQLDRFTPNDEGDFAAYLIRVAKNKWIDELRKNKTKQTASVEGAYGTDPAIDELTDETDTYIDAVKKQYRYLGARCRELLGRFYFRKQSLREIAAVFEWTEASAKNNKYRCLKQLRESVLKEGGKNG